MIAIFHMELCCAMPLRYLMSSKVCFEFFSTFLESSGTSSIQNFGYKSSHLCQQQKIVLCLDPEKLLTLSNLV